MCYTIIVYIFILYIKFSFSSRELSIILFTMLCVFSFFIFTGWPNSSKSGIISSSFGITIWSQSNFSIIFCGCSSSTVIPKVSTVPNTCFTVPLKVLLKLFFFLKFVLLSYIHSLM